jgi:hypothetical protein
MYPRFAWLIRRVLDLMIEFIWPLYSWLQQFTIWHTVIFFRLDTPRELFWLPTELLCESHFTTDGQSASLSWNKAPIWGLGSDFYYCQTIAGLLMWGALSDERTGLSFTITAGPRQRSHFRVWDSRPYFTVWNSTLRFSSPPTTRRATVEVFVPASTRDSLSAVIYCWLLVI